MTVNLSPENFRAPQTAMTVNLNPGSLRNTGPAMTVDLNPRSMTANSGQANVRRTVRLTVESYREFPDGVTRYQVRVETDASEWIVQRRFSDFECLEKQLAPSGTRRAPLPAKGILGLQHKMNLGDFKEKRQLGLQAYLSSLVEHIGSLSEMPALEAFCDPAVQGVTHVADGSSNAKAVAGAAAAGAITGLMMPVVGGFVVAAAGAGAAAYATQRSDNIGEVSRNVGSVTAKAFGHVAKAVKTAASETSANR